jgi:hypothetical protein
MFIIYLQKCINKRLTARIKFNQSLSIGLGVQIFERPEGGTNMAIPIYIILLHDECIIFIKLSDCVYLLFSFLNKLLTKSRCNPATIWCRVSEPAVDVDN